MTVEQKKIYGCVAGCCGVFFLLACFACVLDPVISRDGTLYLEMVNLWQKNGDFQAILGRFSNFWIPPFYLWLVKNAVNLGVPLEVAGRGVNILAGSMLPLIVFLIAQEVQKDKRVSLLASVLIAVNPCMLELSIEVQRDMLYLALSGWIIYFCLRGLLRKEILPWIPAGILCSCSMLTRYETTEFMPLLFFAFLLFLIRKKINWKLAAGQIGTFVCSVLVSFCLLVFLMGVQGHLLKFYQTYYSGKYTMVQMLYAKPELSMEGRK